MKKILFLAGVLGLGLALAGCGTAKSPSTSTVAVSSSNPAVSSVSSSSSSVSSVSSAVSSVSSALSSALSPSSSSAASPATTAKASGAAATPKYASQYDAAAGREFVGNCNSTIAKQLGDGRGTQPARVKEVESLGNQYCKCSYSYVENDIPFSQFVQAGLSKALGSKNSNAAVIAKVKKVVAPCVTWFSGQVQAVAAGKTVSGSPPNA